MYLVYIDDSADERICVFSALAVRDDCWNDAFRQIREFRCLLRQIDGIYIYKEFHAWKFVSGRGQIADRVVPKWRRCEIFKQSLQLLAQMQGVHLFNSLASPKKKFMAYERLLNRIHRALQEWDSFAILIVDQGSETEYTRLTRQLRVYNPIPSKYGEWEETGTRYKNIPIERIIEDPFFKDSAMSYWIQMVDFCSYALLRYEHPLESKMKYGLHEAFPLLEPILMKKANPNDRFGVVRID